MAKKRALGQNTGSVAGFMLGDTDKPNKDTNTSISGNTRIPENKGRISVQMDMETCEAVKNAAYYSRETVREIVERAILKEIKAMEKKYNDGDPFPTRARPLSAGRKP